MAGCAELDDEGAVLEIVAHPHAVVGLPADGFVEGELAALVGPDGHPARDPVDFDAVDLVGGEAAASGGIAPGVRVGKAAARKADAGKAERQGTAQKFAARKPDGEDAGQKHDDHRPENDPDDC
ncbi:MAG: hypothetical protein ACLVL7_02025 [Anaerotruncus massiliensis (ex Togo et al. 2019)]